MKNVSEELRQPVNRKQPSKIDDAPLIPLADFENVMREALTVTPEEVARREAEYQRQQADKRKSRKASKTA